MFKLRTGYLLSGIITGFILLVTFIWTLPDGKLHVYFCNVGQGDGAYVKFPDGRDMVVDAGPDNSILTCLGKYMPFWDRHIDIALLTHPQKDHMQGFLFVFDRYTIGYFVKSDVDNDTQGYGRLEQLVKQKQISTKYIVAGDTITLDKVTMRFIWPSVDQIAKGAGSQRSLLGDSLNTQSQTVLGTSTPGDLNDYSLVFFLRYGSFDVLFTGDADGNVELNYLDNAVAPLRPAKRDFAGKSLQKNLYLADEGIEVLKVPHHGSKTGMTSEFIRWVYPIISVISVGKNSYGHPTKEALSLLADIGSRVLRTDQDGDVEVVSDGRGWEVKTGIIKRD